MKTLIATTLALASLISLPGCHREEAQSEPVRPVLTTVVQPGAASGRDVYSGELHARHEADVGFRVAGKLVARLVDAGARVKKGQVLARLDPQDAQLTTQAAAAQVASAQADLTLARSERDRYRDLLDKKFISQSAYDAKENAFAAASAKLDQARSQSAIASNQAGYTTLVADADGVVLSVAAEPGQVVTAGQAVLKLAREGEKEVVVNAPEGEVARFHVGDAAAISLWADAQHVYPGRVREIAGGADPVTRTFAVRVSALDLPASAQLGMTANVALPNAIHAGVVVLPLSALANVRTDPAVWIVDPRTSRVQLRKVSIGEFREDGVVVNAGLSPGDIVVTAGVQKLRPDQPVRLPAAATQPDNARVASQGS